MIHTCTSVQYTHQLRYFHLYQSDICISVWYWTVHAQATCDVSCFFFCHFFLFRIHSATNSKLDLTLKELGLYDRETERRIDIATLQYMYWPHIAHFFRESTKAKSNRCTATRVQRYCHGEPKQKVSPPRLREWNRGKEKIDDRRMQGERPLWYPRGKNARIDEAAPKEKITTAYFPIVQP